MAPTFPFVVPLVPRWQAEQARVDPEHWFAEYKFMQDEIDELREQLAIALAPIEAGRRADAWQTLGPRGEWVGITEGEFQLLLDHGVGRQRRLFAQPPSDADRAMPLEAALALADHVSPMPAEASAALRSLRARIRELEIAAVSAVLASEHHG